MECILHCRYCPALPLCHVADITWIDSALLLPLLLLLLLLLR
jgi:hypothetical protein